MLELPESYTLLDKFDSAEDFVTILVSEQKSFDKLMTKIRANLKKLPTEPTAGIAAILWSGGKEPYRVKVITEKNAPFKGVLTEEFERKLIDLEWDLVGLVRRNGEFEPIGFRRATHGEPIDEFFEFGLFDDDEDKVEFK